MTSSCSGACAIWDSHLKSILNSNLAKSFRLPITYFGIVHSFCNFAQSTAVTLSYFVQNYNAIGQMKWIFMDGRDFARFEFKMSFRWISDIAVYPWVNFQWQVGTNPKENADKFPTVCIFMGVYCDSAERLTQIDPGNEGARSTWKGVLVFLVPGGWPIRTDNGFNWREFCK